MSRESVEVVRRIYDGWSRGDFTVGVALFERHATLVIDAGIPDGGVYVGREGIRTYMAGFLNAWASLTIAAERYRDAGDSVLVDVRQTGVGEGSGVQIDQRYFQLWTFRGGRVIRLETMLREAEALEAVGLSE